MNIYYLKGAVFYPLSFFLAVLPIAVMFISREESDAVQNTFLIHLFSVCILLTFPIYVLSIDFGRWIYITAMSLMFITIPLLYKAKPRPLTPRHVSLSVAGFVFVVVYASTWSFPVWNGQGLRVGFLWRILSELYNF
jgi:hypothetical protein